MTYFLLFLNFALMLVIPIGVAMFIHRRTGATWRLFFIGAVTFVLSQVFHIPFNWLVQRTGLLPGDLESWGNLLITATFLGLSAGVFEETARYLTYRYWAKDARSWSRGLMLGAGHGGIEAILLGLLGAVNIVGLLVTLNNEALLSAIPAEQQAVINASLANLVATPWYGLLLGAAERVFAITAHLALSVMVLQVFRRGSLRWLFVAIGYHAVFNMIAVIAVTRVGPYATEGLLAVFSLLSLFIIFRLRSPDPTPVEPEPLPQPSVVDTADLEPTEDVIDRSRYQ
ncbi:MAG: YhfC family intramembrane metalloprotease [Anaerolineae bacterium]|uniref:YhfC family intramembrane metalloprotease n=1 Tax=Promineifilum sp. TaxID=2664178 RepID=UPI001D9F5FDB|nr:YhfC family intramembrane metalloprotease [Anaerolineales bacterium]MCB8934214.1 YhfC family intramembrane metalloprotease [Promineifilum sp.]MCO5179835.1 YhfC family intramembrane metalloprotease [Promineifilum sp.]MCW5845605.1 YhfC family intramembrane metalloprotease [Anaerolineae bacterium]